MLISEGFWVPVCFRKDRSLGVLRGGAKACCQLSLGVQTNCWAEVRVVTRCLSGPTPRTVLGHSDLPACRRIVSSAWHIRRSVWDCLLSWLLPSLPLKTPTCTLRNIRTLFLLKCAILSPTLQVNLDFVCFYLPFSVLSVVTFTLKISLIFSKSILLFLYCSHFMYIILLCTVSKCFNLFSSLSSTRPYPPGRQTLWQLKPDPNRISSEV